MGPKGGWGEEALSPFGLPPTEQDLPVKGGECNCRPESERQTIKGKKKKGRKLIMKIYPLS